MRCPICYVDLDGMPVTPSGTHCESCGHLWLIVDGVPVAPNGIFTGLTADKVSALVATQVDG